MLKSIYSTRWKPVELIGWSRRAYGRKVFYESEGGTLAATLKGADKPRDLHLNMDISGRMLVQVFCNDVQVLEELVSHAQFDTFVDLSQFRCDASVEVELHLIPATYGEVKIHHEVSFIGAHELSSAQLPTKTSGMPVNSN